MLDTMMENNMARLSSTDMVPDDLFAGLLVGRVWISSPHAGPRPFVLRNGDLFDLSRLAPTLSELFDLDDVASRVNDFHAEILCSLDQALNQNQLLAPCDLQAIKASGVTFADSLIERVLEEKARGDPSRAAQIREQLTAAFGGSIAGLKPGSEEAMKAKALLIENGLWSQYLEVGIGPDAEIFTKAQPMSAVGCGAEIGLHSDSEWSSSEPEIVLAVSSRGAIVGATLGNDLSLRDFEGRSALLLARAKDNNASCSIGPFVRLFDRSFGLDDVRSARVHLKIIGRDQFEDEGSNCMSAISRDPGELVRATIGPEHQYPDGLMLFLGTMFVPTRDRDGEGSGFTHKLGDTVRISTPKLGALINTITTSEKAQPWTFGVRALTSSLSARGLL
jgi:fumarylacetoacetate (FAA) hydrolase family protein